MNLREYNKNQKKRRVRKRRAMTVCIAAISVFEGGAPTIVGASDRMVSSGSGEIGSEPEIPKIVELGSEARIVGLIAGVSTGSARIYQDTVSALQQYSTLTVQLVADTYAQQFAEYRRRKAERALLTPLGLTSYSLATQQLNALPTLKEEMRNYRIGVEAIVTGVDTTGAHVYTIAHPGQAHCNDFDGYSAIGIGGGHADSEFMFAGYTNKWSFARTLLLAYWAKKRAQAAPEVGENTDLFFIDDTGFRFVLDEPFKEIDKIYRSARRREVAARQGALDKVDAYVKKIIEQSRRGPAPPTAAAPQAPSPQPPPVSGGPSQSEPES